jgi:hypothetical protein
MATNSASAMGSRAELQLWIGDGTIGRAPIQNDGKSVCLA